MSIIYAALRRGRSRRKCTPARVSRQHTRGHISRLSSHRGKERASLHQTNFFLSTFVRLPCDYGRNTNTESLGTLTPWHYNTKLFEVVSPYLQRVHCMRSESWDFATSQEKVTVFNNFKDLHRNCPSNHGICLCHLEWWPNSKAEKAAALILPESQGKSTSIANKVRLLIINVILQNQNVSLTTKSTKHVAESIVTLRLSIS